MLVATFGQALLPSAYAAKLYWNGLNNNTGDWTQTGNWSTSASATSPNPSAVPGSGDDAYFNISAVNSAQSINLNASQAVDSLNFSSTGTVSLLGGGSNQVLTLGTGSAGGASVSGDLIYVQSGAGSVTIGSATAGQGVSILLNGSQQWSNNSSNVLTINNSVSNVGNTAPYTLTLNGLGSGGTTFNGAISDGGTTGKVALTINSPSSTTTLAGANTYTGATTLSNGTLSLTGSLASTTALVVGSGTFSYAPTVSSSTQIVGGLTVNSGASTINASSGNTLNLGVLTARNTGGTAAFDVGASGTISTSATNTGSTGILGPWATYGSGSSLQYATVSGGTIASYSGATTAASTAALTDTTGNVNYSYTGTSGGTLSSNVTANTLQFTTTASNTISTATNTLSLNGIMNNNTGTATISGNNNLIIGSTKELVITGQGPVAVSAIIANNSGGASGLTMSGSGTLSLSSVESFTGPVTVNSGTLAVSAPNGVNSTLSSVSSIAVNRGGTISVNGDNALIGIGASGGANVPVTINTGGLITQGGNYNVQLQTLTLAGGTLASGAPVPATDAYYYGTYWLNKGPTAGGVAATSTISAPDITLQQTGGTVFTVLPGAANGIDLEVSGYLGNPPSDGSTAKAMVKAGAGVMRLDNADSNTGGTVVNAGTLQVTQAAGQSQSNTLTNGSNSFTATTTAGLAIGQTVSASGLLTGTQITSINGTTVTLSNNYSGTTAHKA